ncbi:MAG TPA: hypothetical protein VLX68_15205 [Chitinivibrionales bacterium]|nr:hypothetical protein [Chitinivibrionales bacterium]
MLGTDSLKEWSLYAFWGEFGIFGNAYLYYCSKYLHIYWPNLCFYFDLGFLKELFVNIKRYFAASFVVFVAFALVDFLFDFLILGPINHSLKNIWRPDMIHWLEPVTYLAAALLFVFLLTQAHVTKNVSGGIFYGLLVGILVSGVHSFGQYASYPIPFILSVLWFAEGLIQYTVAGIIASLVYRPKTSPNS